MVFVWIGKHFEAENKTGKAFKLAQEFIAHDSAIRDANLNVIVVKQDHEPSNFTGFFFNWDTAYFHVRHA